MINILTRCPCGCNEKYLKIVVGKFYIWYFTDCGEWWFRIGMPWIVFSYSPCQGFKVYKLNKKKTGRNDGN